MTNTLFSLTAVAVMAACFLCVSLLSATFLARWRPALAIGGPIAWLDGLRGLAATLVLLNHIPLVITNHLLLDQTIGPDAVDLVNYFGVVGVQIFFCITGYLFASKILGSRDIDWTEFFVRRIRRLVPGYAAAVLVALIVGAVFVDADFDFDYLGSAAKAFPPMMSFGIFDLPEVQGFDMGRLLGVNWTLAVEWRFYAVLPLLFALRRCGMMKGPLFLFAITLLLMPVLGAGIWLFFIVGAAATLLPKADFSPVWKTVLSVLALACVLSMSLNWEIFSLRKVLHGLHVAFLFFVVCILKPRWLATRAMTALGTISYSLYLLHITVLFVLFGLCHFYLFDVTELSALGFTLMSSLGIFLSVLIAALSYEKIERRFLNVKPASDRFATAPVDA